MAPRTSFAADAAIVFSKAAIPATPVGFLAFDLTSPSAAKATAEELLERDALGYTGFQRGDGGCFAPLQLQYLLRVNGCGRWNSHVS
jgi:hypothetical protein